MNEDHRIVPEAQQAAIEAFVNELDYTMHQFSQILKRMDTSCDRRTMEKTIATLVEFIIDSADVVDELDAVIYGTIRKQFYSILNLVTDLYDEIDTDHRRSDHSGQYTSWLEEEINLIDKAINDESN